MPDWSYQTVFRPILFRLPVRLAQKIALGGMGTLIRMPWGSLVIEFMGHMRPDPRIAQRRLELDFPTPVGLGIGVDDTGYGAAALSRLGMGFAEVGPFSSTTATSNSLTRLTSEESIALTRAGPQKVSQNDWETVFGRIGHRAFASIPIIVRIDAAPTESVDRATAQCAEIVSKIGGRASMFSLATVDQAIGGAWSDEEWKQHLRAVVQSAGKTPVLVCIAANADPTKALHRSRIAGSEGVQGVIVCGRQLAQTYRIGRCCAEGSLQLVARLREEFGRPWLMIASGGVHEPCHALDLFQAGADLVQVDSGLVFSGPGLPKRINEAVLYSKTKGKKHPSDEPASRQTWFWTMLIAVAMTLGGLMALAIASTRVVMPYDEAMVDMTRDELSRVNDRLLPFMTHDRVTLAGTMLSVGLLYCGLSWWAVRHGMHWARQTIVWSASAGFATFFSFLGFGYFDPLHAFVTTMLFQFLLFAVYARLPPPSDAAPPDLHNDWRWRLSQWGQLVFVIHGAVIITAGVVISCVGMTTVFVPEDLEFMQTTADQLYAVPRLVPLIAHDRATFGGMLISCGLGVLLCALWGFRRGAKWLWWSLQISGSAAYLATIWVHLAVGYTHFGHLLPAYGGFTALQLGLALTFPFMCMTDPQHQALWREYLASHSDSSSP